MMNELLRMANELIETIGNMYADERLSVVGRDNVVTVIKGYQDLLRRIIFVYDSSENLENLGRLIEEASLAIPKERLYE